MSAEGPAYRRIVLKVSGEGFCRSGEWGIDIDVIRRLAAQCKSAVELGIELAVVVGGGNIVRGHVLSAQGVRRASADYMGMLATVINGLALQEALEDLHCETRVMSAISMREVAEPYIRRRCIRHLEKGRIVILAGGTGNPYFTTDTTASLRATEIGADVLIKATKVDGVYSADPLTHPEAEKFDRLSYMEFIKRRLGVMDTTAITLCMENHLPILVVSLEEPGGIEQAIRGQKVGTIISGE